MNSDLIESIDICRGKGSISNAYYTAADLQKIAKSEEHTVITASGYVIILKHEAMLDRLMFYSASPEHLFRIHQRALAECRNNVVCEVVKHVNTDNPIVSTFAELGWEQYASLIRMEKVVTDDNVRSWDAKIRTVTSCFSVTI